MSNLPDVYQCIECEQHFCCSCEPGVDQCEECHLGPLCPDCAVEHDEGHRAERECDECGAEIPDHPGGGAANRHHEQSCSLYDASKE